MHETQLASLGTKSSYIYDEVNATTYRLNGLISDFHDGNRRRYARDSELVGGIDDAKRLISRVNSSVSYNRVCTQTLDDYRSGYRLRCFHNV